MNPCYVKYKARLEALRSISKGEKHVYTTVDGSTQTDRNLRSLREYILNFDFDAYHYDPKTGSMRKDPPPDSDPNEKFHLEDKPKRTNEGAMALMALRHAKEAFEKGQDVHKQAAPSRPKTSSENQAIKEKLKTKLKETIIELRANAASEEKIPPDLPLGQSERQVEYDRAGRIIKSQGSRDEAQRFFIKGPKVEKRVHTTGGGSTETARNLHIQESLREYILNFDFDAYHYDPKTGSVRKDPPPDSDPNEKFHLEDKPKRTNEGAMALMALRHAKEAFEKGQDVHKQAAPSRPKTSSEKYQAIKEKLKTKLKDTIIELRANAASEEKIPRDLPLEQSERQVDYDGKRDRRNANFERLIEMTKRDEARRKRARRN